VLSTITVTLQYVITICAAVSMANNPANTYITKFMCDHSIIIY